MKKITNEEINKILEDHKKWLGIKNHNYYEPEMAFRANFTGMDLTRVDFSRADLREAIFTGANLEGANFEDADLRGADFTRANLQSANFRYANLSHAFMKNSDLRSADLSFADLSDVQIIESDFRNSILCNANLRYACLDRSDLRKINFYKADLSDACLKGTNLDGATFDFDSVTHIDGADFSDAMNVPYIPMVCPEEGSFIGWKKCRHYKSEDLTDWIDVIVKLEIPSEAKRSSGTSRKCRCNIAKVIGIYNLDGSTSKISSCNSMFYSKFIYEVGKTVKVTDFDENRFNECSEGIHFFINREEAVRYLS